MCEKRNIYSSVSSHWLMNWTIYCLDSCAFLAMTKDSHLQVERFSSSLKPTFKDGVMGKSVPAAQFELSLLWLWFKCSRSTLVFSIWTTGQSVVNLETTQEKDRVPGVYQTDLVGFESKRAGPVLNLQNENWWAGGSFCTKPGWSTGYCSIITNLQPV